ncbi:MAG: hypothetical protein MJ192_06750 [Clostridia bacterium]|nr:hypothetical protein [Clostridia bacterium]
MKKLLAITMTAVMILSALCVCTFPVSAESDYTVTVTEQTGGVEAAVTSTTNEPVLFENGTAAADAAVQCTLSYYVSVPPVEESMFKEYSLYADGQLLAKGIQANYNEGNHTCTLFITLPEGHYNEVIARAVNDAGMKIDVLKFTNLTITAPVNALSDEGWEVVDSPVWELTAEDLATKGAGANAVTVTLSDDGYANFQCTTAGDPYLVYVSGSKTQIGRYLLIKYNNPTIIPRMQIYMAQSAGITSDNNMIEFDIACNQSGWTYVIVDLSKNQYYDKDGQSVYHFRFDALEARNVNGGKYKFTGDEYIDLAYIKGFTTKAGLQAWLEANELHEVTKTATVLESQLTEMDGKKVFIDEKGIVRDVTANEDGTFGYTFTAQDVKAPVSTKPVYVIDGSKLKGDHLNASETDFDIEKGYATYTAVGADPNTWVASAPFTGAQYLSVKYRTTTEDNYEFFLSSTDAGPAGGQSFVRPIIADGEWHVDVVDLAACGVSTLDPSTWNLNFLRFDFFCAASEGTMDVEYVAFHDTEDGALQYKHVLQTYTVTFTANNQVVAKVLFEAGATSVKEPAVPEKEGYTGVWKEYTMADKNFTVKAVYTEIEQPTEAPTEAPTDAPTEAPTAAPTEAPTAAPTEPAATTADTEPATEAEGTEAEKKGCGAVISGAAVLFAAMAAAVVLKKKH